MQYFVHTPTGQKFGPADLFTLTAWVKEGRIMPNTKLEEANTGRQMMANQVAGLGFPPPGDYYQGVQPSPADYPRIVDSRGDKLANTAIALGISGFFICFLLAIGGMVVAAMAMKQQSPRGRTAMAVCVGSLLLQGLLVVVFFGAIASALGSMGG